MVKSNKAHYRGSAPKSYWRESLIEAMKPGDAPIMHEEINVGKRLQQIRASRGLSMRALAEKSGLNFNTLSLIENEKSSPNVNTLEQLASALQVSIAAFFESSLNEKEVVFQKKDQRAKVFFPHGELEDLGGGIALGEATPLLMISKAHSDSGSEVYEHTGQEFIFCLEGELTYFVGDQEYHLKVGDSLIFQARIPHHWENQEDKRAVCILIICPSDVNDDSVSKHLSDQV